MIGTIEIRLTKKVHMMDTVKMHQNAMEVPERQFALALALRLLTCGRS